MKQLAEAYKEVPAGSESTFQFVRGMRKLKMKVRFGEWQDEE